MEAQEKFHELSFYTLAHPDQIYFIHQHVVDAYQAQTADQNTKPIALLFSLVGLYLYLEKHYSGRQVQRAHMKLAQNKKAWPKPGLPDYRGAITVADVLRSEPGPPRDLMIKEWCASVWKAYNHCHEQVAGLVMEELFF